MLNIYSQVKVTLLYLDKYMILRANILIFLGRPNITDG